MAEASLSSKLSGLERSHSAESSLSTRHPDRRKQLVAGLLRQMQRQYGSDAVRTRLIEGELQAAPELRGGKITPGGLQAVEKRGLGCVLFCVNPRIHRVPGAGREPRGETA